MSADHPAPLAKLITTAEAVDGLRDLFAAEESLDVVAGRVAETALAAIPGADVISITVLSWPEDARTAAYTHDLALDLDHQQYASGQGPCLEAAQTGTSLRVIIGEEPERWPEFDDAAQRQDIHSSLSVPLLIAGTDDEQERVGSLNVYGHASTAFDQFDAELMRLYSAAAGQAISNSRRWQKARETVTQLETALISRVDIDMAKGALIALHGCDPNEAFEILVRESQRRNMKLRDIVRELLDRMQKKPDLPST